MCAAIKSYEFEMDDLPLKRDSDADKLFRKCAIDKYTMPANGVIKIVSPEALVPLSECFRQMKRKQLENIAAFLLEEIDSDIVWPELFTAKPTMTQIRRLDKEGLSARTAHVFIGSLEEIVLFLPLLDLERLLELNDSEKPFMVGFSGGNTASNEPDDTQLELSFRYGNLLECGLLACRAVTFDNKVMGYQLMLPKELSSFLKAEGVTHLLTKTLADIVDAYAMAAANLYGVISVGDLKKLIQRYEREIAKTGESIGGKAYLDYLEENSTEEEALQRTEFRKAVAGMLADADVEAIESLLKIAEDTQYSDGYYFVEEHVSEYSNVKSYGLCVISGELLEEDEDGDWRSFTPILAEQEKHIRYYPPSYTALMAYADPDYLEPLPADDELTKLFCTRHQKELLAVGSEAEDLFAGWDAEPKNKATRLRGEGPEAERLVAKEIVHEIRLSIRSSYGQSGIHEVMDIIEECGIRIKGLKEANEIVALAVEMNNEGRLWVTKGNKPKEIYAREQFRQQGPAKLVFGPNMQGTNIPAEIAKTLESGKFKGRISLDPDEVARASKPVKIERNDPCPCGSGRKYKNCCGRDK